ncbi:hypothetical protein [Methylobacterium sp.]|uniref:hypothetical protein n=1 Tax=Methylobacterium sp. TaxID=409 RepID=UPI003AFF71CD
MSAIFDASECDDWLHSKQAELRALMAEARSVRREAAVMREANAQSRFRLQQAWASISAQWGLTPPADAEPEAPDHRLSILEALNLAGLDEGDLDDVATSMCAAYQAAVARDDEVQDVLRNALMSIGRHIAAQMGPKAAGVVLS